MILFENDLDPAMRYEGLARAAFDNCGKYGDPFSIAAQDLYYEYVPVPTIKGKRNLAIVLYRLIFNYPNDSEKFIELEQRIWQTTEQEQIIDIIDEGIDALNEISEK